MPKLQKKKKAQKPQIKRPKRLTWRQRYGAHTPVKRFKISILDGFEEPEHADHYNYYPRPWRLAQANEACLDIYKEI